MSVIHYANTNEADAMILSVDHQAAFDMVEWPFIYKTLEAMNFGENFIKFIKVIYCEGKVTSAVNVNGFISNFFSIGRGIRQGCPLSPYIYVITSEVVAHFIRHTILLRGIPLCGTNTRITKYADDTSLFLSKWQEIDFIFRIFNLFKNASGSRLKPAKTQLLLLGNMRNALVPERFNQYVVKSLKLYGFLINSTGLDDQNNWLKCTETVAKLSRRLPPYGVSLFGKIHFVHIYYLCMFNYLTTMITPPTPLINAAYKAIVRFLWFPSNSNIIARDVLKLHPKFGGIGFPDIETRIKVSRLMFFVRVLTSKEELSWRRCFDHFYRLVQDLSKRQINAVNCPIFYKEIRFAVVESNFMKVGEFCWFFGEKVALKSLTPNIIYNKWTSHLYMGNMRDRNHFWGQHLGLSDAFVSRSWSWAKTNFVDGLARDIHYKIRHKSLFTNHKASNFVPNVQPYCSLCAQEGNIVREDNVHVLMFCPRAYNFYFLLSPTLQRIAEVAHISMSELVLGKNIYQKTRQTCFNFLIQHCQLAIWQSRNDLEKNRQFRNTEDIFATNVFRNLCRIKTVTKAVKFFRYFGYVTQPTNSVIGFRLAF
jgi:hypothetical protein